LSVSDIPVSVKLFYTVLISHYKIKKMKITFLLIAIALSIATSAQITKVSFQASGLTCSMCSNAIFKALKTLDFVDKVDADVKTYTFDMTFKANSNIDFDLIKKKVEGAGFAISGFIATIQFNSVQLKKDQPVAVADKNFLFVNGHEQLLNGIKDVKLIDKGFVASNEYRKNNFLINRNCFVHSNNSTDHQGFFPGKRVNL